MRENRERREGGKEGGTDGGPPSSHPSILPSREAAARRGFTLWELTMVLLILAITATLAAPALARFGTEQPATAADAALGLLHDARKAAIDFHVTSVLWLDPKTLRYQLDT